jgi:hypothetical protein
MLQIIANIIQNDCESQVLDFKLEPYPLGKHPKKYELLKDFCAFVNNPSDIDKFIIIGVEEKDGRAVGFKSVNNEFDEAAYQQYIFQNIEPAISFEYKSIQYQDHTLSYFRIFNNKQRPYLFKKNINDPDAMNVNYKIGDGFIRRGTSTEKLNRDDLEKIYLSRYKSPDRKTDLNIDCFIDKSDEEIISDYNLDFIDVIVENNSSKSIGFDLELRIKKTGGLKILTTYDARTEIRRIQQQANNVITGSGFRPLYYPEINPLNISIKETQDHYIATLVLLRDRINTVILSQKSADQAVFNREIIILAESQMIISGEIILKSDSFTEGPLIKEFCFKADIKN